VPGFKFSVGQSVCAPRFAGIRAEREHAEIIRAYVEEGRNVYLVRFADGEQTGPLDEETLSVPEDC
jgi:hypothetical protein